MVKGTMVAVVPTLVPMMRVDRGITRAMRMRKGTLRSRFTTQLSPRISPPGRGRMPPASPATSRIPSGRPMA